MNYKPTAWAARTAQGFVHSYTDDEKTAANFTHRMKQGLVCLFDSSVVHALQARIDALMLEYEPEEMTAEQLKNWAIAQKPVRAPGNMTFEPVDPCPGCRPGVVCRTPSCGRLKMRGGHDEFLKSNPVPRLTAPPAFGKVSA